MKIDSKLYEQTYNIKNHFSFGKNWSDFLSKISTDQIKSSERSLTRLVPKKLIVNKSFIDMGCGSGLFSLAAYKLGASKIVSVDVDKYSVNCALELKKTCNNPSFWSIVCGSILNNDFIKSLGKYDIVYSWGVLHHTGNMYKAFNNILYLCKNGGILVLAVYNNNHGKNAIFSGSSNTWHKIKKIYNNSDKFFKSIIELLYYVWFFVGYIITLRNPFLYIKKYNERGMNFYTDVKDWLGGYPYEYATPDELINFFSQHRLYVKKIISTDNLGCHQIVFEKHE
ncbi:MAG: Methyltransferase family protein [Candidatus Collierbacteria bacterium GW2011_GWE1_46_18]|uniref:Methyltransferase family protein n=1 Tax=Candidatus Collierbacteria bacterium GW2011_GWE1_46_18 TaxID=1618399 RepID=A0A0G1PAP3_9BACT|nr:MAG: Methyltransferase family protein [Candidatus Collierbacteria bacterium GW2011_GWE1_46_18]HBD95957.1 class I SAM-dependent methyltransferase [Spirochaetia bacterium]